MKYPIICLLLFIYLFIYLFTWRVVVLAQSQTGEQTKLSLFKLLKRLTKERNIMFVSVAFDYMWGAHLSILLGLVGCRENSQRPYLLPRLEKKTSHVDKLIFVLRTLIHGPGACLYICVG